VATLEELVYVLAATVCGIAIGFAIMCYKHYREHNPKKKRNKKVKVRYMRMKCSKLFNSVYRYYAHNSSYSD